MIKKRLAIITPFSLFNNSIIRYILTVLLLLLDQILNNHI